MLINDNAKKYLSLLHVMMDGRMSTFVQGTDDAASECCCYQNLYTKIIETNKVKEKKETMGKVCKFRACKPLSMQYFACSTIQQTERSKNRLMQSHIYFRL